jgi:tetratricopeptide (TPR) repeat protein
MSAKQKAAPAGPNPRLHAVSTGISSGRTIMKRTFVMALSLGLAAALSTASYAQSPGFGTEMIGSHYQDDTEKAANHYARGLRAKRKAENESDGEKKRKHYERAKKELSKAVGFVRNYDHLLALGQVYLALGEGISAYDACSKALALKPGDASARECQESAEPQEKRG